MTNQQNFMTLLGRVLLAILFVPAGFSKLGNFAGTAGYIASAGLPFPSVGVVVAIIVELILGIMLAVGFKTRIAAFGIAIFTLLAAFSFHHFWTSPEMASQQLNFFKNLAIAGGLFAFASFGGGAWSVDAKLASK